MGTDPLTPPPHVRAILAEIFSSTEAGYDGTSEADWLIAALSARGLGVAPTSRVVDLEEALRAILDGDDAPEWSDEDKREFGWGTRSRDDYGRACAIAERALGGAALGVGEAAPSDDRWNWRTSAKDRAELVSLREVLDVARPVLRLWEHLGVAPEYEVFQRAVARHDAAHPVLEGTEPEAGVARPDPAPPPEPGT